MNLNQKLFFLKAVFLTASILTLSSCKKNNTTANEIAAKSDENSESYPSKQGLKLKHVSAETKEYLTGKHICVIYGYGCNDSAFVQKSLFQLSAAYGVETENNHGLILAFVFPDDFMHGGKPRVSTLVDLLDGETLAGLIIFGAPDAMSTAVAKLEDAAGGTLNYPVFSFFSQDDVLGAESTSNFVLDYEQKTDSLVSEENTLSLGDEAFDLIINSVQAMINLRGPVPEDKELHSFVQKLVGSKKIVNRYYDSETGLQSINHFVIN